MSSLRLALISDVHANLPALDAVLADIGRTDVDELYCLGDLVGYGPDPEGIVRRVRGLGIATIRGNYDDGIGNRRGDCGCYYASEQARRDGETVFAFTDSAVGEGSAEWLASLPEQGRFEIAGRRVLLAHGSPRRINEYLQPDRPAELLARLADQADADLVCIGHVHVPYHRTVTGRDGREIHYVNAGSVGKPKDGDPRACWVELVMSDDTVESRVHRVEYDVEGIAQAVLEAGLPQSVAQALREG